MISFSLLRDLSQLAMVKRICTESRRFGKTLSSPYSIMKFSSSSELVIRVSLTWRNAHMFSVHVESCEFSAFDGLKSAIESWLQRWTEVVDLRTWWQKWHATMMV